MIKFSIITVTKNDSILLRRTRLSLTSQSYQNWKHYVIDGNSEQQHQEYLNSLSDSPNTCVQSERDEGIYFAMNKGWHLVENSSYVIFLNSGDEFSSSFALESLAQHIEVLDSPNLLFTQFEQCDASGENSICKPIAPSIANQLFAYGYVSHQATIAKREVFDNLNGFDTKFKVAADWDFIVRAMVSHPFHKIDFSPIRFYTGGFSTQNIELAHRELKRLRRTFLNVNLKFRILEYLWELIYLNFLRLHPLSRSIFLPFVALNWFGRACFSAIDALGKVFVLFLATLYAESGLKRRIKPTYARFISNYLIL